MSFTIDLEVALPKVFSTVSLCDLVFTHYYN